MEFQLSTVTRRKVLLKCFYVDCFHQIKMEWKMAVALNFSKEKMMLSISSVVLNGPVSNSRSSL